MTQLELVKNEQVIDQNGEVMKRTVVAVSSSHSALVEHCKDYFGEDVQDNIGGGETYFTIQESEIRIIQSKF